MVEQATKPMNPADFVSKSSRKRARSPKEARAMLQNRLIHRIKAGYDASKTTLDNQKLWAQAVGGTPDQLMSSGARRILRDRSRYEVRNNSYAKGILNTLANDTIGTGPRLQVLTEDRKLNRMLEKLFFRWSKDISLAEKLRIMRISRAESGEVFPIFINNLQSENEVTLDIRIIEADFVTSPIIALVGFGEFQNVDGVLVDDQGNERQYIISNRSKDFSGINFTGFDSTMLEADQVMHYVKRERPGQIRGVPEITTSLPLFAQLRRFTLAVLACAETAADFTLLLESDLPVNTEPQLEGEPFELVDIEKRMAMTLPIGWKGRQLKAEQPSSQYDEFLRALIREIARPFSMPLNIALGDSSGSNFASGRLDHLGYFKQIEVERSLIENVILDRTFRHWLLEAKQVFPEILLKVDNVRDIEHRWFWDGFEHIDPLKEAKAIVLLREAGLLTDAEILAQLNGQDWETTYEQVKKEKDRRKELGIPREKIREEFFVEEREEG